MRRDDEKPRRQIAIYGKGGIGKSTTVSNLAVLFGMDQHDVLLVGCDPKHDTSYKVCDARPVPTVLGLLSQRRSQDLKLDDFFIQGRHGVSCIEAGGPEPGVGCAGRGLSKMFELFESMNLFDRPHDVIMYDVLGDVVCGGFAVPMRKAYATEIVVVVSGEIMSLYAANNICRALVRLQSSGVRLIGLIGNLRGLDREEEVIEAFAERLGTRVLHCIPRDNKIVEAELRRLTVVEHAPESAVTAEYKKLYEALLAVGKADGVVPRAMGEIGFEVFVRECLAADTGTSPEPVEAPPEGFSPSRFSTWLARALTSRSVHCQEVAFAPDGSLCIRLATDDDRVELRLGPHGSAPNGDVVQLPFASVYPSAQADADGPWQRLARYVGRRLNAVREKYRVPLLELLKLDEPHEVFAFGPGLFHWRIADFLVAGQTRVGPWIYAGEHFDGMSLIYRFESARGNLAFRLDMGSGRPGAALSTHHLSLSVQIDERSDEERLRPEHQVERYLGFLLSLSDPPSARYDYPHHTEAIVAGSTQDWGADLSMQFFADPGYDFLANYYTAFGLRWPVAYLFHGERECSHMGTYSPAPFDSFIEHPMHVRPRRGMSDRVFVTDLSESDSVMGGEDRLREALLEVGNRPDVSTVIVQDTCVVRVIGDDIRRCIAEAQDETRAPLLYLDATAMDEASPFEAISGFWAELLEAMEDPDVEAQPSAVNLVGYGMSDDPPMRELAALLEHVGVPINAALFPGLDRDHAARFRAGSHNVVSPWQYAQKAFQGAAVWSGLPSVVPALPYGPAGTRRWLAEVERAVKGESAKLADDVRMSPADLSRWESLTPKAGKLGAAFALVSTQAQRLLDAPGWLGVPIAPLLSEMGFHLHVLCFDPPRVHETVERVAPDLLEAGLREIVGPKGRLTMHTFERAEELPEVLAREGFDLVYSEIRDDPRISAAGKAQFSLVDLAMGFEGAVQSLDRLLGRARPTMESRYGRYLSREVAE